MAKIAAFKAFRAKRNTVHLVASRSFVSYSKAGLAHKLNTNPYSFINIINPQYSATKRTKANSPARFKQVQKKFQEFLDRKVFIQDKKDSLYLYKQEFKGNTYIGLIAGASIDDYQNGIIKKHEHTILKRETTFKKYLEITDFNAEPILITYPNNKTIDQVLGKYLSVRPEYEFMSSNSACHEFWIVEDSNDIGVITREFEGFDSLYIADGHHRCASSNLLGQDARRKNPDFTGKEHFNYMLAFYIPESRLNIMEFNRLVEDLNGLSDKEFIEQVEDYFDVKKISSKHFKPRAYNEIGMYLGGSWYALNAKIGTFDENHPVERLDVSILSNNLLDPILGIRDLRTDRRVQFMGGRHGEKELMNVVDKGKMKVAFALHPVTMEQLKTVANNHLYMPPKSTYIEPKLRSGLTLFRISDKLD
ncbi:MAG: hypothetical protein CL840_17530 [Crocinitomicaceae bacterium]|nr:hypothetical protein [Crocinitomicaceae bacterium]|tara:strand:- start:12668 stop:13924 length:1257 start_codon:yes stop_codon:yes gene_type:complete